MNSYSILFFSLLCVQTVKPACIYKDFFTDSAGRLSRFSVHSVDKAVSKLSKAGYDIESVRKDFPGLSLHGLVNRILHAESLARDVEMAIVPIQRGKNIYNLNPQEVAKFSLDNKAFFSHSGVQQAFKILHKNDQALGQRAKQRAEILNIQLHQTIEKHFQEQSAHLESSGISLTMQQVYDGIYGMRYILDAGIQAKQSSGNDSVQLVIESIDQVNRYLEDELAVRALGVVDPYGGILREVRYKRNCLAKWLIDNNPKPQNLKPSLARFLAVQKILRAYPLQDDDVLMCLSVLKIKNPEGQILDFRLQ